MNNKSDIFKLDLQRHSEDPNIDDDTKDDESDDTKATKDDKTFTQEDLDRIVSDRIKREREKFEETIAEKERMAKLSAEEQAEEQRKKREKELEDREKEITFKELEIETKTKLAEENIPIEFTPYLIRHDKDSTIESIDNFKEVWEREVQNKVESAVNEKIGTPIPKRGQSIPNVNSKINDSIADIAKKTNIRLK